MLHRHCCPNKPANAGIAQRGYLQNCNWKLRKVLTRKIKKQAYQYDIKVNAGFGVRNNQVEHEAAEKIQGVANKIAKEAANKAAVDACFDARFDARFVALFNARFVVSMLVLILISFDCIVYKDGRE